jgi:2',3'-cyclic-nucleotide 2'-phosphodiesterase (5'-nucleotidase family)
MLHRRRVRRSLSITVLAALAATSAWAIGATPAAAAEPYTGTVSIVHINDVHSNVFEGEPGIGYGRAAAYAEAVRSENPNTMFLDAGDVFAGSPYSAIDEAASLIPVLNTLGLDAMTLGNAEFTYGSSVLEQRMAELGYPVLGGNMVYRDTQAPIAPTTTVLTLPNGMTVGLVGVTTPASGLMGANDLEYVDAIEVAREGVADLRAQGVDLLVGLVHLGELDSEMSSPRLAEAITDFDVIIDGHSHTAFPEGLVVDGTLIAQAGGFSEYIGRVDLELVDGEVRSVSAELRDLAALSELPPRPETQAALEQLRSDVDAQFAEEIGSTLVHLDGSRSLVRTGEAAVANMFADAVREATDADIAFLSAGYVGGNIPPGPITRRQLFEIARVDTGIVTKRMTGQQILLYIDRCIRDFPAESGEFIHVSGAAYQIDADGAPKVHSVTVGGEPIGPETVYTVALPAGGAEFPGAIDAETVADHGAATPMLETYLVRHSPVSPVLEGRILLAETPIPGEPGSGGPDGDGRDAESGADGDSAASGDSGAGGDSQGGGDAAGSGQSAGDRGTGASSGEAEIARTGGETPSLALAVSLICIVGGLALALGRRALRRG